LLRRAAGLLLPLPSESCDHAAPEDGGAMEHTAREGGGVGTLEACKGAAAASDERQPLELAEAE
jgi:hypothetical protein|tara:strand:- start:798 stop:989 length:192 start_codon:yes stop_codon:yes gene_type:complete